MEDHTLQGTYECSLDNRFRFAIPAKVRAPFAEGAVVAWWLDECLIVAPSSVWTKLITETFGEMSLLNDQSRELTRFLLAGAEEQTLDKQGRVLVPAHLRAHAELESKISVVGAGRYLEAWNPQALAARFAALRKKGVSAYAKELASGSA